MEKLAVKYGRPIKCLGCPRTTLFNTATPPGWIAEIWKTMGGKDMRVVICFSCRNLTRPYPQSDTTRSRA